MSDTTTIIVSLFTAIPPTITALAAFIQARKMSEQNKVIVEKVADIHKETNSMKDALVAATKSDSFQKGHAAGIAEKKGEVK